MRFVTGVLLFMGVFFTAQAEQELKWLDVSKDRSVEVDGLAWFEQNGGEFIRLPLSRTGDITPNAWAMSLCPSTARVRFKTNSSALSLKIDHGMPDDKMLSMWHMSSVAVSGIDLYIGEPGNTSFWKTTIPKQANGEYEHIYFENLPKEMREFTLYLPSYASLKSLKIGVLPDSEIALPTPYAIKKPIVVYGTSITQGGCSSRGSNGYVAQLERRLNADVVNLGFSGSGCGEPAMADIMSQVEGSVYIVDSVANMDTEFMDERYENFVRILRKNRPDVPIILMTEIHFAFEIDPVQRAKYDRRHKALFDTYNKLMAQGDKNVYLFDTGAIIQPGGDHPTVDEIHLTDRGFYMIADKLVPFVRGIISNSGCSVSKLPTSVHEKENATDVVEKPGIHFVDAPAGEEKKAGDMLLERIHQQDPRDMYKSFTYNSGNGQSRPYRLLEPENYDPTKKYPLILLLHHSGLNGSDNEKQIMQNWLPKLMSLPEARVKYPCFVLVPQAIDTENRPDYLWDATDWWTPTGSQKKELTANMRIAFEILEKTLKDYSVDTGRVYVAGESMGGYGTFEAVARRPHFFAAAVVVCGGYDDALGKLFVDTPMWIFHGEVDEIVPAERGRKMAQAILDAGGAPRYWQYRGINHYRCAELVFGSSYNAIDWMFAQTRTE